MPGKRDASAPERRFNEMHRQGDLRAGQIQLGNFQAQGGRPIFGEGGQRSMQNRSSLLIHPVKGVMYADVSGASGFTTGMGMHGAAGELVAEDAVVGVGHAAPDDVAGVEVLQRHGAAGAVEVVGDPLL